MALPPFPIPRLLYLVPPAQVDQAGAHALHSAARYLRVDPGALSQALTTRAINIRGEVGQLCGMVRYGVVWYGMVWYGMVWYGMVWYGMVWYLSLIHI